MRIERPVALRVPSLRRCMAHSAPAFAKNASAGFAPFRLQRLKLGHIRATGHSIIMDSGAEVLLFLQHFHAAPQQKRPDHFACGHVGLFGGEDRHGVCSEHGGKHAGVLDAGRVADETVSVTLQA